MSIETTEFFKEEATELAAMFNAEFRRHGWSDDLRAEVAVDVIDPVPGWDRSYSATIRELSSNVCWEGINSWTEYEAWTLMMARRQEANNAER